MPEKECGAKLLPIFLHLKPTRASFTVTVSVTCHPGPVVPQSTGKNPIQKKQWCLITNLEAIQLSLKSNNPGSTSWNLSTGDFSFNSSWWFFLLVHDGWKSALKRMYLILKAKDGQVWFHRLMNEEISAELLCNSWALDKSISCHCTEKDFNAHYHVNHL